MTALFLQAAGLETKHWATFSPSGKVALSLVKVTKTCKTMINNQDLFSEKCTYIHAYNILWMVSGTLLTLWSLSMSVLTLGTGCQLKNHSPRRSGGKVGPETGRCPTWINTPGSVGHRRAHHSSSHSTPAGGRSHSLLKTVAKWCHRLERPRQQLGI